MLRVLCSELYLYTNIAYKCTWIYVYMYVYECGTYNVRPFSHGLEIIGFMIRFHHKL